jgi:hypothetical protein
MAITYYLMQPGDTVLQAVQPDTAGVNGGYGGEEYQSAEPMPMQYFVDDPSQILRIHTQALFSKKEIEIPKQIIVSKKPVLPAWNFNADFFQENSLTRLVKRTGYWRDEAEYRVSTSKPDTVVIQTRTFSHFDWFLGLFLLLAFLFIWIRMFYGKYFSILAGALGSSQMSTKLFRERNVLVRRVSIVLDFIYLVILSMFTFEVLRHYNLFDSRLGVFNQFMLILNIVMIYSLLRVALLRMTGNLFLKRSLFLEYIHSTFVVNKSTGLFLLPVVVAGHYFPQTLVSPVMVLGLFLLVVAFIWKTIRGYQIIKRKDIAIFYLILYLCTLEILPLLIGYKFIITLI